MRKKAQFSFNKFSVTFTIDFAEMILNCFFQPQVKGRYLSLKEGKVDSTESIYKQHLRKVKTAFI
jgi:hypothetical protein